MKITRRTFLKGMAAGLAISAVPAFGVTFRDADPQWFVEEFDWGNSLGVGAKWIVGGEVVRHACRCDGYKCSPFPRQECIDACKQALRQWFAERGTRGQRLTLRAA